MERSARSLEFREGGSQWLRSSGSQRRPEELASRKGQKEVKAWPCQMNSCPCTATVKSNLNPFHYVIVHINRTQE